MPNATNEPTPPGAYKAPTGGLLGLAHRCQYYQPPAVGIGLEGHGCPGVLNGLGAFAQLHWMGGGMTPYKSKREGEWCPKVLDGRATGPYTSWEGHGSPM